MTVTIHRRDCSIRGSHGLAAWWIECSFDPLPAEQREHGPFRHDYQPIPPVEAIAPAGSRLVDREISGRPVRRLAYHRDTWGICAESVYYLARCGEKGFAMPQKKRDDGPSLFGPTEPDPPATAYPKPGLVAVRPKEDPPERLPWEPPPVPAYPVPRLSRDELAKLAAEVVAEHKGELGERLKACEDGMRRAIDQLTKAIHEDQPDRMVTARAILEGALDWSPAESSQAKSA